jgi:hypothetical protein
VSLPQTLCEKPLSFTHSDLQEKLKMGTWALDAPAPRESTVHMKRTPTLPRKPNTKKSSSSKATASASNTQLSTPLSLSQNVLPRRLQRTLRYAETLAYTTGAAGVVGTINLFRLNSLFDPNQTGVGHQPYGFDQLSLFYQQYIVHSYKVTILANTIGGTAEVAVCYALNSNAGFLSIAGMTLDRATEAPMVGTATLGPSGVNRAREIIIKGNCWDLQGQTKAQYLNQVESNGAGVGSNPAVNLTLQVGLASYSGTAAEGASIQVIIEYAAEFMQPVQMPQS